MNDFIMDIYSPPGTKIVFMNPNAGYQPDQDLAAKYLVLGTVYTVDKINVGSFRSNVILEEIPNVKFNTVSFKNIK